VALWYIYCSFGIFFPELVCCTKKNLATLRPGSVLKGLETERLKMAEKKQDKSRHLLWS
jgi:hypothetical protein